MDGDRLPINAAPVEHHVAPIVPVHGPTDGYLENEKEYELEKKDGDVPAYKQTSVDIASQDDHYIPGDPLPFPEDMPLETNEFTVRAVFVGCALGAVVQASNLYLGLKTGFTFGPQLLGGIGGFLVLKPLSRVLPKSLPGWVGAGYFGPKENVVVQSAATAAGGLGILFVSGFPAMYQIGLLSPLPKDDIGKLIGYMLGVAFYGMSFAIPLRAFYILRQRLTFPTPSATAYAIRSLHTAGGSEDAKTKGKWLFWSFLVCFIQKTASTYAPGILYDWHFFYWFATWGAPKAQLIENWGWFFEVTPAFFGAGILSGMNASWSFYIGSIFAWGIIGPAMVATGRAVGVNTQEDGDPIPYRSYYSMSPKQPASVNTSPRYNLLWIGVLVMLVSAFVELAVEWRTIGQGFAPIVLGIRNRLRARKGLDPIAPKEVPVVDPAPKKDQVPWWVWSGVSIIAIVITCIVQGISFKINVGISILAIILAFLFSFIGVLGAGTTDVNPVSTCAKASQLIVGGATHGYTPQINPVTGHDDHVLRINLLSGMIAAGAAGQAADLTGDLKTGHLIRAKPIAQYFAQLIGAFCSVFLSVAFFILFTTASPCILDAGAENCQYGVPSASAWRSVAIAVTSTGGLPVPTTSGILAIVFTILAALIIVFRAWYCPPKYKVWVVNPSAWALAFVLPQTQYGAAMALFATLSWWYQRRNPSKHEQVAFTFAAGMITGEGLGGVMQAILTIAGAGPEKGTTVGCVGGEC